MPSLPYIKFFPGDWLRDEVSGCSLSAQGLWLRMLILAHDCTPRGVLEVNGAPMPNAMIARKCGCDLAEFELLIAELDTVGVVSHTRLGSLYSRRMVRDTEELAALQQTRSEAGKVGAKRRWGNGNSIANAMANGMANGSQNDGQSRYQISDSKSKSGLGSGALQPEGGGKEKASRGTPMQVIGWLYENAEELHLNPDDSSVQSRVLAAYWSAFEYVKSAQVGSVQDLLRDKVRRFVSGKDDMVELRHLDKAKTAIKRLREQTAAQSANLAANMLAESNGVPSDV